MYFDTLFHWLICHNCWGGCGTIVFISVGIWESVQPNNTILFRSSYIFVFVEPIGYKFILLAYHIVFFFFPFHPYTWFSISSIYLLYPIKTLIAWYPPPLPLPPIPSTTITAWHPLPPTLPLSPGTICHCHHLCCLIASIIAYATQHFTLLMLDTLYHFHLLTMPSSRPIATAWHPPALP